MPGLIWVRDLVVGEGMVDGSVPVGCLRPLGLWWAATRGWEPQQLRELVGSVVLIEDLSGLRSGAWVAVVRSAGRDGLQGGGAEVAQDVEGTPGELARDG